MDHTERTLALRVVTQPADTNHYGTVFGGVILSYIDQAGYVEARRHGAFTWVTACIQRVDFEAPVGVGDVVSFYTRTSRLGRTSLTVEIEVESERVESGRTVHVTSATMTLVALDEHGRPTPILPTPAT
ncbi:MAG: acyl-CoA thioesterase [Planctomycetota bacterium]|nr:MAG: acyl-CoA thioesterase [Planctomycetota bacterium]